MPKKLSRMIILAISLVVLVTAAGFSLAASREVIVAGWGGSMAEAQRKAYFEPFEKATGIKVIYVEGFDIAKVAAMVENGKTEWDLIDVGLDNIIEGTTKGRSWLEPIDYSCFNQAELKMIPEEFRHKYGIGSYVWAWVLAYSTKAFPGSNHPKSWRDFWNVKKFPGPRALESGSSGDPPPLEMALLADGVSPDKLYPLDADRAFASLDRIRPHVVKWWMGGAEPGQMLIDGEVAVTSAFSGRVGLLKQQGAPIDFVWNEGLYTIDYWGVVKNAPNKENAMKFVAFASEARNQAALSKLIPYGPVNSGAFKYLDAETENNLPTAEKNKKQMIRFNCEFWMVNRAKLVEHWQEWVLE